MLVDEDLAIMACPESRGALEFRGERRGGALTRGRLRCQSSRTQWCVEGGLARLYREARVTGSDEMMRKLYDRTHAMHDFGVRYFLPLWGGGTERQIRDGYMPRLELETLAPPPSGRPLRILEVGIGTGANLPLIYRRLPPGVPVELWGLDLSLEMLRDAQRRIRHMDYRSTDGSHIRLMLGDAHTLPFADSVFDRVFHVGGIAGFNDPRAALSEMARVARPGTPIVVVDEALDPDRPSNAYHRAMFKMLTSFASDPHVPREHIPYDASITFDEQLTRFYYCLVFTMP